MTDNTMNNSSNFISSRTFLVLILTIISTLFISSISSTCLIFNTREIFAVPGSKCDKVKYEQHIKPIYDIARKEKCTIGREGKAYKAAEKIIQLLNETELQQSKFEADHLAKSICLGKAPMNCVPGVDKYDRCKCIDDGKNGRYRFQDDTDTCVVKKGGYCAAFYEDFLECEPGTKCHKNKCISIATQIVENANLRFVKFCVLLFMYIL